MQKLLLYKNQYREFAESADNFTAEDYHKTLRSKSPEVQISLTATKALGKPGTNVQNCLFRNDSFAGY
ncbi:MAG: hypothetical protein ACSLFH_03345 [Desulfuromonadales bacterium]